MNKVYQYQTHTIEVSIQPNGDRFQVVVGDRSYNIAARQLEPGHLLLEAEGQQMHVYTAQNRLRCYVAAGGETWVLEQAIRDRRGGPQPEAGHDSLTASMPGVVLEVLVTTGESVERGQTLVLLEAMKMELRVTAPHPGTVSKIHCETGQVVERGQLLVEMETD